MGTLSIITWNCSGETRRGARALANVIDAVSRRQRPVNIVVVQGADPAPGGHIHTMLSGLDGDYHPEPAHAAEGGRGGRGYLLLTRRGVTGQDSFARADLAGAAVLRAWTDSLCRDAADVAVGELTAMGMPAFATLCAGGHPVRLLTWRVPRGRGRVLPGVLDGGANPDAFGLLRHTEFYAAVMRPGPTGLGLVAGDLGVRLGSFNRGTGLASMPQLLPGVVGMCSGLQHILGTGHPGRPEPSFPVTEAGYIPVPGHEHAILHAIARWADRPRRSAVARGIGGIARCPNRSRTQ